MVTLSLPLVLRFTMKRLVRVDNGRLNGRCRRPVELFSLPQERSPSLVDVDTFLTTLYVIVDDGCRTFVLPAS